MRIRRLIESQRGSALVELAVALPILVLVMVITVDFARVFYLSIALTNAARAGAQYGGMNGANSGNVAMMQTTATGSINITGVAAVASRLCQCATDAGVLTANNCTTSCTSVQHRVVTVTVTTTKSFETIMSGVLPGISNPLSVSRSATSRVPD